jgi:hypothetical protein
MILIILVLIIYSVIYKKYDIPENYIIQENHIINENYIIEENYGIPTVFYDNFIYFINL